METRPAVPEDVADVAALWVQSEEEFRASIPLGFGAPMDGPGEAGWQARWLRGELGNPNRIVWVAVRDGAISGFLLGEVKHQTDDFFHAPYLHVAQLIVARSARRTGIGRALMQAIEREARERGWRALDLEVSPANVAAISLYEGLGFTVLSRRMARMLDRL